jgi:hypothetical protein
MKRLGDLELNEGIELAKAQIDTGIETFDFRVVVGRGSRGDWQAIATCSHKGTVHFRARTPTAPTYDELEPKMQHMMAELAGKYGCHWEFCGVEMGPYSAQVKP